MTDNGMDVAIAGEGFFQVQDGDGNTFYTRAGMLNIDSAGNLVDLNGNFVLGVSGNPLGKEPGADRIQLSVPAVEPAAASATEKINDVEYLIKASNLSKDGNVAFNFTSDSTLPLGQAASAEITSTGINIKLNKNMTFNTINDLNNAVNDAILQANNGEEHPGGKFTMEAKPATAFPAGGLTGDEIASKNFAPTLGSVDIPANTFGSISFKEAGTQFAGEGATTMDMTKSGTSPNQIFTMNITAGGKQYTGTIPENATEAGTLKLSPVGGEPGDFIIVNHGGFSALDTELTTAGGTFATVTAGTDSVKTVASKALGLSSKPIKLQNGTAGGPQTVADLSSVGIGPDGMLEAIHPVHGRLQLGRIDVVTFENSQGLQQAGNTYFTASANSGTARYNQPGSGGAGGLASGSLEMSNVDLSREFSDMITTQRGFQANSRIITVSDEMLTELVNLKR